MQNGCHIVSTHCYKTSSTGFDEPFFERPRFPHSPPNPRRPLVLSPPGVTPVVEVLLSLLSSSLPPPSFSLPPSFPLFLSPSLSSSLLPFLSPFLPYSLPSSLPLSFPLSFSPFLPPFFPPLSSLCPNNTASNEWGMDHEAMLFALCRFQLLWTSIWETTNRRGCSFCTAATVAMLEVCSAMTWA